MDQNTDNDIVIVRKRSQKDGLPFPYVYLKNKTQKKIGKKVQTCIKNQYSINNFPYNFVILSE